MKKGFSNHFPGLFDTVANEKSNSLYYGDNLTIMQNMRSSSVDLIYLDPPFNSQRNYNLIYRNLTGQPIPEQEEAFCDAWEMDAEKEELVRRIPIEFPNYGANDDLVLFWQTWIKALRYTQPHLLAYLIYMTYRLFEMRRILKPTGSIYLHCDSTASHYIKVIMDSIFGHSNFRSEIIWKRTTAHSDAKRWSPVSDTILYYSKSSNFTWNTQYAAHSDEYVADKYRNDDNDGRGRYTLDNMTSPNPRPNLMYDWMGFPYPPNGWRYSKETMERLHNEGRIWYPDSKDKRPRLKRYLSEMPGRIVDNIWTDISPINSQAAERLGYPTQKPTALLERIIKASSNEGDVIFDPFCGCGTAVYAAHLLGRKWIGCDIAILSVKLVRDVLLKRYGLKEGEHYEISGIPVSVEGAKDLFERDPHQFQHWAVELVGGFASTKRSGDLGIDGRIHFETGHGLRNMVLSVKGGKLTPAYVRELRGVLEREPDTEMGGFICLQTPTKGMLSEAASAGTYNYRGTEYQRLQIRTIQDLLDGNGFDTPSKVQTLSWITQMALPLKF
jgi:DNA modification methylase